MQLFILDEDIEKNAQYHCDKHVVKQILEAAQIASTAAWMNGVNAPYRPTHKKHPCVLWAAESYENYSYVCRLGLALCDEYTHRYGKVHKSQTVLRWLILNSPKFKRNKLTPFVLAMPEKYWNGTAVPSYRKYYLGEKMSFAKWTKREAPPWISS